MSPSHVAILVPSVKKAAETLIKFNFEIGEIESFEETNEIYVQGGARNALLLMEAKKTGSYRNALKKRGPGFHHFAIDVHNLEKFLASLKGSGWLLHLNSLDSIKKHNTAYLARPGFPALIEVHERKKLAKGPLFVEQVSLSTALNISTLVESVGLNKIVKTSAASPSITLGGKRIELKSLF